YNRFHNFYRNITFLQSGFQTDITQSDNYKLLLIVHSHLYAQRWTCILRWSFFYIIKSEFCHVFIKRQWLSSFNIIIKELFDFRIRHINKYFKELIFGEWIIFAISVQ